MSATLEIISTFSVEINGITYTGKQGTTTDPATTAYELTIDGKIMPGSSTLATATAVTLWDEDDDNPTGFDVFFLWTDKAGYIQFIGTATNAIFAIAAKLPFWLTAGTVLGAANTTAMSGSAPSVTDIDSIVLQNNSGDTMNYAFAVMD